METEKATSGDIGVQLPLEGAVLPPVVPGAVEQKPVVEAPEIRVYKEEEWDKRQSAWDTEQSKVLKEVDALRGTITNLEDDRATSEYRKQEQDLESWVRSVDEAGGDVKAARQAVSKQLNLTKQTQTFESEKKAFEVKQADMEGALKIVTANRLTEEYSLGKEGTSKLLESSDPKDMEIQALRMSIANSKTAQTPREKVDIAVGGVQGTNDNPDNFRSVDVGRMMEEAQASRKK